MFVYILLFEKKNVFPSPEKNEKVSYNLVAWKGKKFYFGVTFSAVTAEYHHCFNRSFVLRLYNISAIDTQGNKLVGAEKGGLV